MITYENCPVCQNIDGAGNGDCPGHDASPPPRYDARYYFTDGPDAGQFISDSHMYRKLEDQQAAWLDHYGHHTRREQPGCEYCRECGLSTRIADEKADRAWEAEQDRKDEEAR